MRNKTIIGIVPSAKLFKNDDPYSDRYEFVNNYIARVHEIGAEAIGVLPQDGYINKATLEICDSFIISGGLQIYPYHFSVVEHCYITGKKLLGICLGMQTIHSFFSTLEEKNTRNWNSTLLDLYIQMKKEKHMFVLPVNNHWQHNVTRNSIDETKHTININENSMLYNLVKCNALDVSSMHNYAINNVPSNISITARSLDGSIEAIEYEKYILGIQFHPEVDNTLNNIFKFLVK